MSNATVQFTEMVREHYFLIELERTEREQALVHIAQAELAGNITREQADEARKAVKGD